MPTKQDWSEEKYKEVGNKLAQEMKASLDDEMYADFKWFQRWTVAELKYLEEHYPIMNERVIAFFLKRTESAIKGKAAQLKLRKKSTAIA